MRLTTVSLALGLLVLTACSSTERPLFIQTNLSAPESLNMHSTQFQWQVQDQRNRAYVLTIVKGDEQRTVLNKLDVPGSLQQQLAQLFTLHGARIDPQAAISLWFKVHELHAQAQQHPLDHEVHSAIEIELNIDSSTGIYRKRFQGTSSYTAPFKVDHAMVERELRRITEQVITDILNDHHWQDYLRSHQ